MRLKPDWPDVLNNLAWFKAAYENEDFHNPNEAIGLARRACELTGYKTPSMLDTLGVAYAAVGRFTEAIETAEKAIGLAQEAKQAELIEDMESHLQLYKENKPYRD